MGTVLFLAPVRRTWCESDKMEAVVNTSLVLFLRIAFAATLVLFAAMLLYLAIRDNGKNR